METFERSGGGDQTRPKPVGVGFLPWAGRSSIPRAAWAELIPRALPSQDHDGGLSHRGRGERGALPEQQVRETLGNAETFRDADDGITRGARTEDGLTSGNFWAHPCRPPV